MRTLKRLLLTLTLVLLCVGALALSAFAAEEFASGTCGAYGYNVSWLLDTDGTLTISGQGKIDDWIIFESYVPWYNYRMRIERVVIEDGITHIGWNNFFDCYNMTSVSIPSSVTTIDSKAFKGCSSLTSVRIPNSVTTLGTNVFADCTSLKSATISSNVSSIESIFPNCPSLTSIVIPSSVTKIGQYSFCDCTSLSSVTILGNITTIGESAFKNCSSLQSFTIPSSVTSIGRYAFSGCTGFTSIAIPNSVTTVEELAFSGCTGLKSATLSGQMTFISQEMFEGCTSLTNITIPDSITEIKYRAFAGCTALPTVTLSKQLTYLRERAFQDCTGLKTITIPNRVVELGTAVFSGCTGLVDVKLSDSLLAISQECFLNCTSLTLIEIPQYVTSLNYGAFKGCSGLTGVIFPKSVTWLAMGVFENCDSLMTVYYSGSKDDWANISIAGWNDPLTNAAVRYNNNGLIDTPVITSYQSNSNGLKISWNAVGGAAKYRVFVKTSKGWIKVGDTTGTSFTYTAAKNGLTYTFTVRCLNALGTKFLSSYNTTGWKCTYKPAPTITKFENTASGIKLTWGKINGAAKYRVFVKTSKGWIKLADTTANSYVYTAAKSGLTYTFTVRAVNAAGTAFTSAYNTTGWRFTRVAQPAIKAFQNTKTGIQISWNKVAGAGAYRVFVKTSKGWAKVGDTTGTSLTWTGGKSGVVYTFTVRAMNSSKTAFVSSFNTTGWRYARIAQPAMTKLTNTSSGINLTWTKINGVSKYQVFVKTSKGWAAIGTTSGTSFTWTGAKKGTTYTFTVRCMNAAGTGYISSFNTTGWSIKRT